MSRRSIQAARPVRLAGLVLAAGSLMFLAACGTGSVQPRELTSFGAYPLEQGDGSWRLSWETVGVDAVTVNGDEHAGIASIHVAPDEATDYVLQYGPGNLTRTLALAPVSNVTIDAPTVIYVNQELAIMAEASASGSDVAPSQEFSWSSSNPNVLFFDDAGNAVGRSEGSVEITAISRQDESVSSTVTVLVEQADPAVIDSFTHTANSDPLEAGSSITLNWNVSDATSLDITEVVTGGVERTVHDGLDPQEGSLELQLPGDKAEVNYLLTARNIAGEATTRLLFADPLALPGWICSDPDDVITIADPVLNEAVWRIYSNTGLDNGDGVLTCGMVQADFFTPVPTESDEYGLMEQHNAIIVNRCMQTEDPVVESLEGIQHLSTLRRLELMCNGISDISRLNGLTGLEELNLDRNNISNISALAGLTELRILGLYQNRIEDLEPLAGLTALQVLYLSENRIKDVTPLAELTNLEHLWLYLNCRDLTDPLQPRDCLQDLSGIAGLHNLRSLVIHANEISDISMLNAEMDRLELVFASHNLIRDISSLQDLPALSTARLDSNLIASIAPLAANADLPSSEEPFYWERVEPGTPEFPPYVVSMPSNQTPFSGHISLHENCLDVASADLAAELAALADRGAIVEGADVAQAGPACVSGLSAMGVLSRPAFNPDGLLRDDSRWYGNR